MTAEISLTIQNGPLAGREYVFREHRLCIIGRGRDCEIRLPGTDEFADVARHHCLLEIDPPHLSVRDLGSRAGTLVNGLPVGRPARRSRRDPGSALIASVRLRDGDVLHVGPIVFQVHGAVPADSPPVLVDGVGSAVPGQPPVGEGIEEKDGVLFIRRGSRPAPWPDAFGKLALDARTAADLMTPHVVSIPASATVIEAEALLRDRGLSAVPVVGEDGQPVGVLSRADIVAFDCEEHDRPPAAPETPTGPGASASHVLRIEYVGPARVQDIMTQVVFAVAPDTPAAKVVEALLSLRVHRLFVTNPSGSLLGVTSMTDVLRHLHLSEEPLAASGQDAAYESGSYI
jgi:CBS domain-containing protein